MEGKYALGATVLLALLVLLMAGLASEAQDDVEIRGVVLDPSGRPLPDAEVVLRTTQGTCRHNAYEFVNGRDVTDDHGRFVLPAPPAAMEVYVRHAAYAPAWADAENDAVVRMEPACWLEGSINTPARLQVSRGPWRFVDEEVQGDYRCGPLPAGLVLSLSVESTTHRPFHDRLVFQKAESRQVDVTLAPGARVTGTVLPAHANATIHAHGPDGDVFVATTTEDGTFTVSGLEDGWVRLVVLSPGRSAQVIDTATGEDVEVRWSR